jgi:DNA mismatch endonuclease, patch repair protein
MKSAKTSKPKGNSQAHGGDIISREKRSALMARIKGKNTGPEMAVRRLLHRLGYRYRTHAPDLPGRPDIVFRSRGAVIFVHGCFWHRHSCGVAYVPKTRSEFWRNKFLQNTRRDRTALQTLKAAGWRVLIIWECQVERSPQRVLQRLKRFLESSRRQSPGAQIENIRAEAKS